MNADTEILRAAHASVAAPATTPWRRTLILLGLSLAALFGLYWRTVDSLVEIWARSDTFAHGFLIAPISLYLVWTRRRELAHVAPGPDWLGLVGMAGACLAWLVAAAGQVQVVQQYAFVAMIVSVVIAIAGRNVARELAFPLAFLFMAVPVGEFLILPLMNWTADFTVTALRLTGIPVYREGTFFTIPSGNWSVVEGCSGLRYLIASITVGLLYAYLTYTKLSKRLVFVGMSIVVPIIANGLRAYMIVMIAHLSDMRLALGIDHLIYGWLFFGLVMLILFWVGSYWRDPHDAQVASSLKRPLTPPPSRLPAGANAIAVVLLAAASPIWAAHIDNVNSGSAAPMVSAPAGGNGWAAVPAAATDWRPRYEGAASSVFQTYRKGDRVVALYLGYYRNQHKGAELLTSTNIMVPQKYSVWENVGESPRRENFGSGEMMVRETRLRSVSQRLLVWDWFRVNGTDSINPYVGKALLARDRLLGRGDDAAEIMITAPYQSSQAEAEDALRSFARDMLPAVHATLAQTGARTLLSSQTQH